MDTESNLDGYTPPAQNTKRIKMKKKDYKRIFKMYIKALEEDKSSSMEMTKQLSEIAERLGNLLIVAEDLREMGRVAG